MDNMHSPTKAHASSALTERDSGYRSVCVVSPGKEDDELKDQDRIRLATRQEDRALLQFAAVCDGITTSPYAAEAAAYAASHVELLFNVDGLKQIVDELRKMRAMLAEKPIELSEYKSEILKNIFVDVVRAKQQRSHQTTFVAVRMNHRPDQLLITAVSCGDSALFIVTENGELLYSNLNVTSASDSFKHDSPVTDALPDSFDESRSNVLLADQAYAPDVHVLLCSDGFYDAFKNFGEMFDWLRLHQAELSDAETDPELLLEQIHTRLKQTKGDDDVSFIWLSPTEVQASGPDVELVQPKVTVSTRADIENGIMARLQRHLSWFRNSPDGKP
jgi:serine/threonine protein phosphatase PrpC